MAKQYYNNPVCVGGTIAAEFIAQVRALKAEAIRINALIKETTNDSNNVEMIDSTGAHGPFWGVSAGEGKGASFRTPLVAITAALVAISDDNLAALDMG